MYKCRADGYYAHNITDSACTLLFRDACYYFVAQMLSNLYIIISQRLNSLSSSLDSKVFTDNIQGIFTLLRVYEHRFKRLDSVYSEEEHCTSDSFCHLGFGLKSSLNKSCFIDKKVQGIITIFRFLLIFLENLLPTRYQVL